MNYLYLLWAVVISCVIIILVAVKYAVFLSRNKIPVSFKNSLKITTASQLLSFAIPFRGSPLILRALMTIGNDKTQWGRVIMVNIVEQLFDLVWYFLLFLFLLFIVGRQYSVQRWIVGIVGCASLIILWVLFKYRSAIKKYIINFFEKKIKSLIVRYPRLNIPTFSNISTNSKISTQTSLIVIICCILLCTTLLYPFSLYCLFKYYAKNISLLYAFTGFWLSVLIGRFSGIAMGLGVRDAALQTYLMNCGIDGLTALKIVLWMRGITLMPVVLFGSFSCVSYGRRYVSRIIQIVKQKNDSSV